MEKQGDYKVKKDKKSGDSDVLQRARKFLDYAKEVESDNRERYKEDIRFARLGEQWDEQAIKSRGKERPTLTFNKIPSFIRQLVNDARQNKPSISVLPVGADTDKDTADVLEGLIRNIEVQSNADIAYDTAIDNAASGGFGYIRVKIDYAYQDSFDQDICIEAVPDPLCIYGDQHSKCGDSTDWMGAIYMSRLRKEEFEENYPKASKVDFDTDFREYSEDWIDDDSITVAEYWERKEVESTIYKLSNGQIVYDEFLEENQELIEQSWVQVVEEKPTKRYKVTQYILTAAEILETNEWPGMYIPIFPVYGEEVVLEGKRHLFSMHHHAKGAQQSYNYWRTSAVEKVALDAKSPWIAEEGTLDGDDNWETANTKAHPYLTYKRGSTPPFRTPAGGVPASELQLALNASDDMKSIIGIYDASLGARSNETSGKAIMARQREGDTSTFHFIDNLSRTIRCMGKCIVDIIPKVYSKERIVRVLGEDGTPNNVQINKTWMDNGIERLYDLTTGKYDVIVKSGPSFTSRREESAEQMMNMIQAFPQSAQFIGDLVATNLDWPGSDKIAKRLKLMLPPQIQESEQEGEQQIPEEIQQQIAQMEQQMQVMQESLQQAMQAMQGGKEMIDDKDAEIEALKLDLKNKAGELDIKRMELDLKEKELEFKKQTEAAKIMKTAHDMENYQNNDFNNQIGLI